MSADTSQPQQATFAIVRDVLIELCQQKGMLRIEVTPDVSIFEDLGLDSLMLVDLTALLEERLGLREFPVQAWIDHENKRSDKRHTVAALVQKCLQLGAGRG